MVGCSCRTLVAALFLAGLTLAPQSAHAQLNKSTGKLTSSAKGRKVFTLEALNAGLCNSQGSPTLTIFADGHQDFAANVRSTSPKDTWQSYVRYFNVAGSFLHEVKWWQFTMDKANLWQPWKVTTKPD